MTSKSPTIHPSAIIEPTAQLGENVKIGPFCYVGPQVVLEDDVELKSHVVIEGDTHIGHHTMIFPFASIGLIPQDKKYKGEVSKLEIGHDNVIREYVTIHPGTQEGGMVTKIGNNGLFMIGVHIAHDCIIGDHVIFANYATLAGHVVVEDYVTVGGLSGVHQFVRIGAHAMIGGMSGVEQDVIPFGIVVADRARLCGLNLIGLKRRGFSTNAIHQLREAYKTLFQHGMDGAAANTHGTIMDRVTQLETTFHDSPEVHQMLDFIKGKSHRNLCMPKSGT